MSIINGDTSRFAFAVKLSRQTSATAGKNILKGVRQCHQFCARVSVQCLSRRAGSSTTTTNQTNLQQVTACRKNTGLQERGCCE
jgi:hypothetical protein